MVSYDLNEVTQSIIQRLNLKLSDVDVVDFPGDPKELVSPRSRRTIFVGIADITAQPPKQQVTTTRVQSLDTVSFELVFNWVDRRSHAGAIGAITTVRNILTGYQPIEGWDRYLYMVKAGFMDFDRGTWIYSMRLELQIPYSKEVEV